MNPTDALRDLVAEAQASLDAIPVLWIGDVDARICDAECALRDALALIDNNQESHQ